MSTLETTLNVMQIQELIPHRYPFLLVDLIKDIIPMTSCTGIKNVTINEPFFQGHFPGNPIMPGVLIIEALAQTAGALVCHGLKTVGRSQTVYFMSIDEARFRKPVVPGDQLTLEVQSIQNRQNIWKFKGEAKVNGVIHAQAQFMAMIQSQPSSANK